MYGIINKSIEEMVTMHCGEQTWKKIVADSGIAIDFFISDQSYDDATTYKLANSISKELNTPVDEILFSFGEYWILQTGIKKYDFLLKAGGATMKEFIINLPEFHNRIALMYPKLQPPEFRVTDVQDDNLLLHYYSDRPGLQVFVKGLLSGIAKMYYQDAEVSVKQSKDENSDHDIFHIKFLNA